MKKTVLYAAWVAAACSSQKTEIRQQGGEAAAATTSSCNLLTASDIAAATGAVVKRIERGAVTGAGGTCVNFATNDDRAYLGMNELTTAGDFASAVAAVPKDIYPTRVALSGLGDEAVLFSNSDKMRYLVARKGAGGVVLFPMGEGSSMTNDQLRQLAAQALSRR
jgi:hypothetical protein